MNSPEAESERREEEEEEEDGWTGERGGSVGRTELGAVPGERNTGAGGAVELELAAQ